MGNMIIGFCFLLLAAMMLIHPGQFSIETEGISHEHFVKEGTMSIKSYLVKKAEGARNEIIKNRNILPRSQSTEGITGGPEDDMQDVPQKNVNVYEFEDDHDNENINRNNGENNEGNNEGNNDENNDGNIDKNNNGNNDENNYGNNDENNDGNIDENNYAKDMEAVHRFLKVSSYIADNTKLHREQLSYLRIATFLSLITVLLMFGLICMSITPDNRYFV